MDQQTLTQINDLRRRVVEAKTIRGENKPIPDGLMPTDEELEEGLRLLRADRATSVKKSSAKKAASNGGISADFDLDSLFDKK